MNWIVRIMIAVFLGGCVLLGDAININWLPVDANTAAAQPTTGGGSTPAKKKTAKKKKKKTTTTTTTTTNVVVDAASQACIDNDASVPKKAGEVWKLMSQQGTAAGVTAWCSKGPTGIKAFPRKADAQKHLLTADCTSAPGNATLWQSAQGWCAVHPVSGQANVFKTKALAQKSLLIGWDACLGAASAGDRMDCCVDKGGANRLACEAAVICRNAYASDGDTVDCIDVNLTKPQAAKAKAAFGLK